MADVARGMKVARFTVLGAAALDHAAVTLAAPVLGASNPGTARTSPGGVGLNVARDLARLGHRVHFASCIGRDADGAVLIAAAEADGVDMTSVPMSIRSPTATYRAAFDDAGGLIIGIADMAILEEITPDAAERAVRSTEGTIVVDANLPAPTLAALARAAEERPLAAIAVSPAKAMKLVPILGGIALLFATRREAAALLGREDDANVPTRDLAADLVLAGAGKAIVTDSGRPLAAAASGEVHLFPPFPAHVRSVNGAGDALAAGVLHGLAVGRPYFEAVLDGLAAAAITVEEKGTVAAGLTAAAVEARIAKARIVT